MTKAACCLAALILGCITIFFVPIFATCCLVATALFVLAMGLWIILTGNITINGDDNDEQHRMGTK